MCVDRGISITIVFDSRRVSVPGWSSDREISVGFSLNGRLSRVHLLHVKGNSYPDDWHPSHEMALLLEITPLPHSMHGYLSREFRPVLAK